MKKSNLTIFAALVFCLPLPSFSQNISIVCNIENGTLKTFDGKTEVFEPRFKKGQVVSVEILDFNNYIYDVEITETIEKSAPADGGFFKGFEALNLGSLFSNDTDSDGVPDFIDVEQNSPGRKIDIAESTEIQALLIKAERLARNLKSLETKLLETETKAENLVLDREIRAAALPEFEKLKFNPNLPVSKIKKLGGSVFERALNVSPSSTLGYDDILEKFEERKAFSKMRGRLLADHFSYLQSMEELTETNASLQILASTATKTDFVFSDMKTLIAKSPSTALKFDALADELAKLDEAAKNDKLEDLVALWFAREAFNSNTFSKKHTTRADGDAMVFNIKFMMRDSVNAPGAKREFALPPMRIPVHGGFKINTSLGVGFSQFFEPAKTYFLENDVIQEEKGDAFLPIVSTFLHFYKQGKGASLGGSIGLGIPVGGSSTNLQSLNFFLGPSLMIGNAERLVISAGLMGGKPARLASSHRVGDVFLESVDVLPLRRVYEMGWFLGVSYNLKG